MAASILSLGMLTARAFWMVRRSVGLEAGSGAAGLDGHGDVLGDAGELLRHAVPAREHRVLADFEDAPHGAHGARSGTGVPAARGAARAATSWGCGERAAAGSAVNFRRVCALQHAQAPALQVQAALDVTQLALQVDLFPLLEHGALLLAEPLLLDRAPSRRRRRGSSRTRAPARARSGSRREAASAGDGRQARLGALELHRQQRPLDLEGRRALQAAREADERSARGSATWSGPTATSARRCGSRARRCGGSCGSPRRR